MSTFIVSREALLSACQLVQGATATRPIKPILASIKLVANASGTLTLTATDLEVAVKHQITNAVVTQPGETMIAPDKLIAVLRESRDDEVSIEATPKGVSVRLGFDEYEMPTDDPSDFPDVPTCEASTLTIAAGVLRGMIARTAFAAAKESTKYAMTGVLWSVRDGQLQMVATDSKRLAVMSGVASIDPKANGVSALVPTKTMTILERHLRALPADSSVNVDLRANEALFGSGSTSIYSRLVEGRYPPYREIIPKKANAKIVVSAGAFLAAVKKAAIMVDAETKRLAFTFAGGALTLQAQGVTTGRSKVSMSVPYDGAALEVNLDPSYLTEMLRAVESDGDVVLELVDGTRPVLMRSGTDYQYVVMPLS